MYVDTRSPDTYWLHGYLREESGAGFRVPVFITEEGSLYTCQTTQSGEINKFLSLAIELETAVEIFNFENERNRYKYTFDKDAPLIIMNDDRIQVTTFDLAATWLFAATLRQDIEPYFKIMCSAILWMPVAVNVQYYKMLKPIFADEQWEHFQSESYTRQQNDVTGAQFASIRSRFLAVKEAALITKLREKFDIDLRRHDLEDFLILAKKTRNPKIREEIAAASSKPMLLICEAIARYLRAIQLWVASSELNQDAALRRLYGALAVLDKAKKVSGGNKYEFLLWEAQRLIQIAYSGFVSYRYMQRFGGARSFSLAQSFGVAVADAAEHRKFLDADDRFETIERSIYNIDRRKKLIQGSAFIGIHETSDARGAVLKHWSGNYTVDRNLCSYQISHGNMEGRCVFAERLERVDAATTRGERFVASALELYFPIKSYRGNLKTALLARNSWLIIVAQEKLKSDLLWGGDSHQALQRRLGVARVTLVEARTSAFAFLKSFVNAVWRVLEVKLLSNGRIIVVHDERFEGVPTLTKLVGFFRALEEVSKLFEPLQSVMDKIHVITRAGNIDEIQNFDAVLKKHLRNIEINNSTAPIDEPIQATMYEKQVDDILSAQILHVYIDNSITEDFIELSNRIPRLADFIELSTRVRGLAGSAVAFAEARDNTQFG